MGYDLFHKCNILFSLNFRFYINVDDIIFYNYGKNQDNSDRFKGTYTMRYGSCELSVMTPTGT